MKTIQEAAKEYIDKINYKPIIDDVIRGFIAGAKFTQQWIDINKETPAYYQPILADNNKHMAVVARVSDGDDDYYVIQGTDIIMNPDPIKYKPIELKQK